MTERIGGTMLAHMPFDPHAAGGPPPGADVVREFAAGTLLNGQVDEHRLADIVLRFDDVQRIAALTPDQVKGAIRAELAARGVASSDDNVEEVYALLDRTVRQVVRREVQDEATSSIDGVRRGLEAARTDDRAMARVLSGISSLHNFEDRVDTLEFFGDASNVSIGDRDNRRRADANNLRNDASALARGEIPERLRPLVRDLRAHLSESVESLRSAGRAAASVNSGNPFAFGEARHQVFERLQVGPGDTFVCRSVGHAIDNAHTEERVAFWVRLVGGMLTGGVGEIVSGAAALAVAADHVATQRAAVAAGASGGGDVRSARNGALGVLVETAVAAGLGHAAHHLTPDALTEVPGLVPRIGGALGSAAGALSAEAALHAAGESEEPEPPARGGSRRN